MSSVRNLHQANLPYQDDALRLIGHPFCLFGFAFLFQA